MNAPCISKRVVFGKRNENENQYQYQYQYQKEDSRLMKKLICYTMLMLFYAAWGAKAEAAQRSFVWTEEYGTLAKDNAELEFWNTAVTEDVPARNASDWNQQVELEYGITDHFNVSLYQVYEQTADSASLTYLGYKVELKYRIGEKNELPVDVLLYVENEQLNDNDGPRFEGKIILAKELSRLGIAYNQIFERRYATGKEEHEYAAGISYEIVPALRLGVEAKGSYSEKQYAVGPTLAWLGNRIWANIGAVYGLNSNTNDREVRFMLGVPF
jgi:predicted porin